MNYPSLPEPVAAYLEPDCSAGAPSDTSNGTPIASKSSLPESATDTCQLPRSLQTCVSSYSPVPLPNIGELRTWLQRASPASRLAARDNSAEQATNAICGPQRGTLFATLDRNTHCWKTSQGYLLSTTLEQLSPTWPKWATWDRMGAYQQQAKVFRIDERGSLSWRTPLAMDARLAQYPYKSFFRENGPASLTEFVIRLYQKRITPLTCEILMSWPDGWTDLKPLAMDKFQEWLDAHGSY